MGISLPAEVLVLLVNLIVLILAFKVLHPKMAGSDIKVLMWHDLMAMAAALLTSASMFWGSDIQFSLIIFELQWFGFTIVSYSLMEIPFFIKYCKDHDIHLD